MNTRWNRRWTIELPGVRAGTIWFDSTDDSLLVADGWGSTFASLSVRRVDPMSGRVLATTRTRTPIRAFGHAAGSGVDGIFLLGDKKIFVHDPRTLAKRVEYAERVPRYANSICHVGDGTVALAAPRALTEYSLASARIHRAAIVPATALAVVDQRPHAVLADGTILVRAPAWEALGHLGAPCYFACIDPASATIAGLPGSLPSAYDASGSPQAAVLPRSRVVLVGSVRGGWAPRRLDLPLDAGVVGVVGDRLVVVDVDAGGTRLAATSVATPGRVKETDPLFGAFAGFAGAHGVLLYASGSSDTTTALSLFSPDDA